MDPIHFDILWFAVNSMDKSALLKDITDANPDYDPDDLDGDIAEMRDLLEVQYDEMRERTQ